MRLRTHGLTLVEILVGLALLGIIMAAVLSLQVGTFRSASDIQGGADQLRELQISSGYLTDRVRTASAVSTSLTVNGTTCTMTPAAGEYPCFAVLVGEIRQVGSTPLFAPNTYMYLAYRLVPRSSLTAAAKTPDSWADSNTLALMEYRSVFCGPIASATCATATPPPTGSVAIPTIVPATLTGLTEAVIADRFTLTDGSGTFTPFAYNATKGEFTIRFRQAQRVNGKTVYTPSNGPMTVVIQRRN